MSSMRFRFFFFAALSTLLCCLTASARPVNGSCEIINTDYAIGKSCQCALRDHYGFLWLGTASGLYAYDSGGQQIYPSSNAVAPTLPDVIDLHEHDGRIWIGASNGLWVYDRDNDITERFPHRTKYGVTVSSPVQKIMEVGDGLIWILTYGQGYFIFDTKNNTLEQNSRNGAFFSDMVKGGNGNIYAVSLEGELKIFNTNGGLIDSLVLPEFRAGHNNLRMGADGTGVMIAAGKTVYHYNLNNKELTFEQPAGLSSDIRTMCSADGYVVFGTDEGLWSYDSASHSAHNIASTKKSMFNNRLSDDHVTYVMPDMDNNLLVLTAVGGVSHLIIMRQPIELIRLGCDDAPEAATAICVADDGNRMWVGSRKGVAYLELPSLTPVAMDIPGTAGDRITSIALRENMLWIGTESRGAFRHCLDTHSTWHYTYNANTPNSIMSNAVHEIFVAKDGELFVLTNWGLCRYNSVEDNFGTIREIDSHKQPLTMVEDRHGKRWIMMADGSIFTRAQDNNNVERIYSESLKGKSAAILRCDNTGELLAAANDNRIYVFDESEGDFVPYSFGVPNDYPLTFMERDRDGRLWLGDASGALAAIGADKRTEFFVYKANSYTNILTMTDISGILSDGRIVYGDENGLRIFNPREMKSPESKVRTYVQAIRFPYSKDDIAERRRLDIEGALCSRNTITVPFSDNTFTLHFATAHAADMPPVRFRYRLDGYDKEWIIISEPNVTYTNLQPGTYTLHLLSETEPDDTATTLVINVSPPWYRTVYAYIIYLILALALGWGLWIFIRHRVRMHYHKRINDMRMQKERETFEAKMQFFVNLVHEIRTPLTLISLPLEQMAENARNGKNKIEDNKKHIKSMRRNVNYLLGIVNQLLDFRKAQTGSEIQLKRTRTDMNRLISDIAERFEHPMTAAGKTFELIMPPVEIQADVDLDKIDRVIMNIVSNAMKYSRTKVTLELCAPADGEFAIKVSDDGTGVPNDERERIFDTYYQISGDDVAATLGTGLGLAYAKLIANAHHGSIVVDNNASGGATFTITLNTAQATPLSSAAKPELIGDADDAGADERRDITILLVDDNAELLATVSEALAQNYSVITATSGEDALAMLNINSDIDFIISDFMMPGMSGARLCRKVKNDMRFSHIPFIMLTAKTDREAKEEGMEAGVDVYVEKPFTIKQIKLQIANMLSARALFYKRLMSEQPQQETMAAEPYINRLDTEFINTLNANIAEYISDEEFSIDVMAERMNMSRSSFYRKLKAITGMTPVDYLKNFRLEHAMRLLMEGERITEVALMSGFTSSSYFSKCFKAKYGQNPKEYVASHRPESGVS